MVATADAKRHAARIVRRLKAAYPDVHCALNFGSPFELLIATILSAQCTDTRVNIVTKDLFKRFPNPAAYATAKRADLERAIQSTGFFRNKAKSIATCCEQLVADYDSQVPKDLETLVKLPGVGRKTANVVLGTAYGIPTGVVVDTHVGRLSKRLGLTTHTDAVKIERDLMELVPKREWINFSHRLIAHGRQICSARKPKCDVCPLEALCPKIGVSDGKAAARRARKPSTAR
jgi:endonuclease-3